MRVFRTMAAAQAMLSSEELAFVNEDGKRVLVLRDAAGGLLTLHEIPADNPEFSGTVNAPGFSVSGNPGVSGTFTTADSKTVTVTNGIITNIA